MLTLLTRTWFLAILQNWGTRPIRADPLEFAVFKKVMARFGLTARSTPSSMGAGALFGGVGQLKSIPLNITCFRAGILAGKMGRSGRLTPGRALTILNTCLVEVLVVAIRGATIVSIIRGTRTAMRHRAKVTSLFMASLFRSMVCLLNYSISVAVRPITKKKSGRNVVMQCTGRSDVR